MYINIFPNLNNLNVKLLSFICSALCKLQFWDISSKFTSKTGLWLSEAYQLDMRRK